MLALPLWARLSAVFVLGVLIATQLNRGIYRLAWMPRQIGPWTPPQHEAPPRRWVDRLPVVGWWFLRREAPLHGRWFWLRPLVIELATGLGLAALYWYEVHHAGFRTFPGVAGFGPDAWTLHVQFFSHTVLIALMIVATFIDFDEKTIPDAITIPGALAGLAIAALLPASRPLVLLPAPQGYRVDALHLAAGTALPGYPDWPEWLDAGPGLLVGWLCLLAWWLAILPWRWTTRRGLGKALVYLAASAWRHTRWPLPALGLAAALGIAACWAWGGERWESLLSALVGMVFGGGLIWSVRIAGSHALGQEAMGFGDVTLMAMLGAFTGWQATLLIFFLAPVAALFISVTQWLLTRRKDIAFGPYLCLATVFVVVRWGFLWERFGPIFALGWWIPGVVLLCVFLIWTLLKMMRALREISGR